MTIPTEFIGPVITGAFALVVGIVAAVMARRGQKLGSRENRAPDVQDLWVQQEQDRRVRQLAEDLWWGVQRAFQSYYRRVHTAISVLELTEAQAKVFELTPKELRAIEKSVEDEDDI